MPHKPTGDDTHLQSLAHQLRTFQRRIDGCTKPHPNGREVVHPVPLREAADDLANAVGAAHMAQWAQHATVQEHGTPPTAWTGQMAIGRGRGADAVIMAAVGDAMNIVSYKRGELPGKRWPQGYVFGPEILATLDRALALVEPAAGEAASAKPIADDLRPARWFADATREGLYPDRLKRARCDGRLKLCDQPGGRRWQYSIGEVCAHWSEYRGAIERKLANESEPSGTDW